MTLKPLLVTSGEPAGIGPDLCIALASSALPIVVLGDKKILMARAKQLGQCITFVEYQPEQPIIPREHHLTVLSLPCPKKVIAGQLNVNNAKYVISMLEKAVSSCLLGAFSALITAPVHKGIINEAGYAFTGHTEFLAKQCQSETVVMMLASDKLRVALVTTHVPLKEVAETINESLIVKIVTQLHRSLQSDFNLAQPKIAVAGLNPHAGESGYLGREEIDIIMPALAKLEQAGINVYGPFSADTLFTQALTYDAIVAMYHDQGLPVIKYASFGNAVNITLGLPIIRTSVDHGTALTLAGTGRAEVGSLLAATEMAFSLALHRAAHKDSRNVKY